MTKIIHIIMLGPKPTFSDNEMENINSWKRNFPGWEFKIWNDSNCMDWIEESSFASYWYKRFTFSYASDYVRCKALYEYGGLYMDLDVYCANPIPEKYFEKSFTAWDVWGMPTTNNGTCFYACEPHLPLFKEFCDCMKDGPTEVKPQENGAYAANCYIDEILRKKGLKTEGDDYYEKDVDLGDIMVLNRSQFGAKYRDFEGYNTHGKKYYLVHQCSSSWVVPTYSRYVDLNYAIIKEDTDMNRLIIAFANLLRRFKPSTVILLFASSYFETPEVIINAFKRRAFRVYLIPCEKGNEYKCAMDFIFKRVADIKTCRNLLRDV